MDWPEERHVRMLTLRQEALDIARRKWAQYILVSMRLINSACFKVPILTLNL